MGYLSDAARSYRSKGTEAGADMHVPQPQRSPHEAVIDITDTASAVHLLPIGVLLADGNGRVGAVNPAWCELSGLNRKQSGGLGWLGCLSPADRNDVLRRIAEASERDKKVVVADYRVRGACEPTWTRWWICATGIAYLGVAMAVADVEAEHALEEELRHQATFDPLTGLMLRCPFHDLLEHALLAQARHPSWPCVLYLDLDGFKEVNDRHGHLIGDELLVAVANALRAAVRPEDVVARLGGDEFAVLCDRLADPADAVTIARRIEAALDAPLRVRGIDVHISAAVGIAVAEMRDDPQTLIERADRAMYSAKRRHGSRRKIAL